MSDKNIKDNKTEEKETEKSLKDVKTASVLKGNETFSAHNKKNIDKKKDKSGQ